MGPGQCARHGSDPRRPRGRCVPGPRRDRAAQIKHGAEDVRRLGRDLDALEEKAGMVVGQTRILVVCTETPAALFNLGGYTPAHARLAGLTWGAEDLSAAVGAATSKGPDGDWTHPYQFGAVPVPVRRRVRPELPRSKPSMPTSATAPGWRPAARPRAGTGSPDASPSIPIRSSPSTPASRRRRRMWPTPAAWWRLLPHSLMRASSGSTERCMTPPT